MNFKYRRNLLEQMRIALYEVGNAEEISNGDMAFVLTLNENLTSLGYCLTAPDILSLASSPSKENFYDSVRELIGEVSAEPMYPDFPKQVMEISEATVFP